MPDVSSGRDAYRNYVDWKGWDEDRFMAVSDRDSRYYEAELRSTPLDGRDVLEIGFGNGGFLGWARSRGATLFGTEVLPEAIERARGAGVTILPLDLAEALPEHAGRFAVIAAFDVMEHLTYDHNAALLDQVAALLAPGGTFVARFPNAQSPFGQFYQHGDHTHICFLSAYVMRQLLLDRPFDVIHLGNQAPFPQPRPGQKLRALGRRFMERVIAGIYGFDAPLGPNTVAVLRRR